MSCGRHGCGVEDLSNTGDEWRKPQDRKGPTLARIEQHVFKRKCWLALNSIAERYLYACRAAD